MSGQCGGETIKPEISVDERVEKCKEKQTYLEFRYRRLQNRINKLRAQKLSNHAVEQLQTVVNSCDKRRARMNGEVETVKTEKDTPENIVVKHNDNEKPDTAEEAANGDKQKKIRVKKYNKSRTDDVLGQIHSQLRHVQHYLDPDATESSSGGESADELDKFNPGAELLAPIQERYSVIIFWLILKLSLFAEPNTGGSLSVPSLPPSGSGYKPRCRT